MGYFQVYFQTTQNDFFDKIMVAEKNNFSSNAQHNFAKSKVIYKYKKDKP